MRRWALCTAAVLGCRFDVEVLVFDAPSPDAGAADAPALDAPAPDAPQPDASVEERCTDRYGATPGYVFCEGADTQCRSVFEINGVSCESRCAAAGGTCLAADDTSIDAGEPCVVIDTTPNCETTSYATLLCTCSL